MIALLLMLWSVPCPAGEVGPKQELLPPELVQDLDGEALYRAGLDYLRAQRVQAAVEVLDRAVQKLPDGADARVQLAVAMSLVRTTHPDAICELGAFPDVILELLEEASALDATVRWALAEQPEYQAIRDAVGPTMRFRYLVQRKPLKKKNLPGIFTQTRWYRANPDGGAAQLILQDGGLATVQGVERDAAGREREWKRSGAWRHDKRLIELRFDDDTSTLELTREGLALGDELLWWDRPPDCAP